NLPHSMNSNQVTPLFPPQNGANLLMGHPVYACPPNRGEAKRRAARPAGQSNAPGRDQRSGQCEPISGGDVSVGVPPAVWAEGRQCPGRASRRAAEFGRSVELGRTARGATGLDGGVRRELVSNGPATRGAEPGRCRPDSVRAGVAGPPSAT